MTYDLVVIGAGPGGEKGAAQAAYFGKRVCVIERAPKPGGAAVNTGTIPSKTLRETALYFSGLRQRGLYGVDYQIKRDISIADFMFRERAVVEAQWALIDENLKRHGIDQVQGVARFVSPDTVEVSRYGSEPRLIQGATFLIASGSQPQQPAGVAVDGAAIFDSDSLLTMDRIPTSMIVVGGGVIACEYACTFAALGVRVTIVNSRSRLLAHLDAEISEVLRQQMASRLGITVYSDVVASDMAVEDGRAVVRLGESETILAADCALFSAGRIGASAELGLREIGVETNSRGFIRVDEHYRTSVPSIYAAGDVIGYPALASTAMEQARVAVCHAFDLRYKQEIAAVLPYGVWTIPEIATVGPTEDELRARGTEFEVGRAQFRGNPRGLMLGDDGFLKLVFNPHDRRLLAAAIVGEGACELIHVAAACLSTGGGIDTFIQNVYNYPALSDAYKYAAYDGLQALARRHASRPGLPSGSYRAVE